MPFALSEEVFARIASYTQPTTLRDLTSLSRLTLVLLRPLLYGRIIVSDGGQALVKSLASNNTLPPMVHSILFLPSALIIEGPMWERVLCEMTHLTQLGISDHLRLTRACLNDFSFQLLSFISFGNCPSVWADLLRLQFRLEILEIRGNILGPPPILPAIHTACVNSAIAVQMLQLSWPLNLEMVVRNPAHPAISTRDLVRFANGRPGLQRLRLHRRQFLPLLNNAPELLKELQSLVIDTGPFSMSIRTKAYIFSASMPLRLVRKTRIRDGKLVRRVRLVSVEREPMPREPITDWSTRRQTARSAEDLRLLADLRLATPYERPGPETPLETAWRMLMQDIADFAEETVAEQEQAWQDAFQGLADWHNENFRPPRIPQIGTQAYFEFVRDQRERFALAQAGPDVPVLRRAHDGFAEPGYRPLQQGWTASQRHDFARTTGLNDLQR
ncbi:hypothetical protein C8J57DRAFT_1511651 [Mycena rebaudengoi]|nr:hypothetical protein C8J57DRAFT_1511651 [Mycena rebaudengoi]